MRFGPSRGAGQRRMGDSLAPDLGFLRLRPAPGAAQPLEAVKEEAAALPPSSRRPGPEQGALNSAIPRRGEVLKEWADNRRGREGGWGAS